MTDYDWWKTNPDRDYAGQRTYQTYEEEELLRELKELEHYKTSLEYELESVMDDIEEVRKRLALGEEY